MDDVVTKNRIDDLLIELSLLDNNVDKELNIVLLSDNDDMNKLNYFIFFFFFLKFFLLLLLLLLQLSLQLLALFR